MAKQSVFENEENEEYDPVLGDSEEPDEDVGSLQSKLETESMWDIFDDYGAKLQKEGDKIKYSIKRNGEYLATVEHPFSYEKIKQKWGGGTYQVVCRSSKLNKYVKSQTQLIDGTPEEVQKEPEKKENNSMELLTILQTMQKQTRDEQKAELERIREESKAEREAQKNEGNSQMMLMMKMMETQSQQQQNLMTTLLTVMAGNKDSGSDKKLDRMFDMMLEMMNNKRTKGEEIDPLQLTKLIQDAEDRGYSRAKELRELAEEEAERLAEIRGSGGKDEKEESTTTQILKSVAPMFAQLAMPGAAIPAALPAPAAAVPKVNPHLPAKAAHTPPKVVVKAPTPAKVVLRKDVTLDKKSIVADLAIKCITDDLSANFLTGSFKPEQAAQKTLDLAARPPLSVDAAWLYANFTLQDMIDVAKAKGMPDRINLYLEKFHSYIGTKAGRVENPKSENAESET